MEATSFIYLFFSGNRVAQFDIGLSGERLSILFFVESVAALKENYVTFCGGFAAGKK